MYPYTINDVSKSILFYFIYWLILFVILVIKEIIRMYIVDDKLPKDCFECKFRTKCNVWEAFLRLPIEMAEIKMDDLELLKPMKYRNCKIHKVPSWIARLYFKFIKGKCKHLCCTCNHKNKCELYLYGRD